MSEFGDIKALTFDVFGTVVDWRRGVAREVAEMLGGEKGLERDWNAFALAWRARYQPSMETVRSGNRGFVKLDQLHRENLLEVLGEFDIAGLSDDEIGRLVKAWHRLDPWPDSVAGMTRLRKEYVLAALSNGHVALIVTMAKRGGIPWDVVLGAEVAGHYKPQPEAYLSAARMLDLEPGQCMMVAAHASDLQAAAGCGFRTAFVARREEMSDDGAGFEMPDGMDLIAEDFNELADRLSC